MICWIPYAAAGQQGEQAVPADADKSNRDAPYLPITNQERLGNYFGGLAGVFPVVASAASAGIGQWRDVPHEWDQGGAGYGARFASSFAQHIVGHTIRSGTAALLAEDIRYVPSGRTGFRPRLEYALTTTVMARSREGSRRISWSKIAALAGTAFLSRLWQPPDSAQPRDAVNSLGVSLGVAAGVNVAHEFIPRLFRLRWTSTNDDSRP